MVNYCNYWKLPSGKQTVCYWKWPSRNSGFSKNGGSVHSLCLPEGTENYIFSGGELLFCYSFGLTQRLDSAFGAIFGPLVPNWINCCIWWILGSARLTAVPAMKWGQRHHTSAAETLRSTTSTLDKILDPWHEKSQLDVLIVGSGLVKSLSKHLKFSSHLFPSAFPPVEALTSREARSLPCWSRSRRQHFEASEVQEWWWQTQIIYSKQVSSL
jgi:hypothetical protein